MPGCSEREPGDPAVRTKDAKRNEAMSPLDPVMGVRRYARGAQWHDVDMPDAAVSPATTDILGEPWVSHEIRLSPHPDYGPDLSAVLVHQRERHSDLAVLYLHGFTDYFFQTWHAEQWRAAGFDFHALDFRTHGRAIGNHPRPGDVRDLRHLDEEITIALDELRAHGYRRIVMLGHSTGGLAATSYAHRHPGRIDALVLNSPWFEVNETAPRKLLARLVSRPLSRWLPSLVVGRFDRDYGYSLHRNTGGEWEYDLDWKPFDGFPARAGFLASVMREQRLLSRGLDVRVPVLVCCSTRTGSLRAPSREELSGADCVLDVAHIVERAPLIGPDVAVVQIPGGLHDLALSAPEPRARYERTAIDWARARMAG